MKWLFCLALTLLFFGCTQPYKTVSGVEELEGVNINECYSREQIKFYLDRTTKGLGWEAVALSMMKWNETYCNDLNNLGSS